MQRETSRYAPKIDKWRARIRKANPDADTGPYTQLRRDIVEVARRRDRLPSDVLGNTDDSKDPELVAPDGPLAHLLIAMGFRDPDWTWAVGDTPTGATA